MNAHIESLVNRMIRIYGYEHPAVVQFCGLAENSNFPMALLETIVNSHERG